MPGKKEKELESFTIKNMQNTAIVLETILLKTTWYKFLIPKKKKKAYKREQQLIQTLFPL